MFWRSFDRWRNIRRAPVAWALAWLALLLNAIAPVIAYASVAILNDHAQMALAQTAHGHASHAGHESHAAHLGHAAHAGHSTAHDHDPDQHAHHPAVPRASNAGPAQPTVAHCQYCLDFAAGAPLSVSVAIDPGVVPAPSARPYQREISHPAKPSLALAYARGPPPRIA